MADIEKTPTLGLNKPPKGYFDWDVPLNENWDKLDFLGAGQLPLLTPHMFEHRLEGDEAIGWAMQGSVLDGDEYKSVWEKLKTAKDRATQVTTEFNEVTYTYFKDATSGWVFLDQANYNKAFENLKDSLGFIVTDVDGKKTITLPKREVYFKSSLTDANVFGAESLPNIKGRFAGAINTGSEGAFEYDGNFGFATTQGGGSNAVGYANFGASLSDPRYQDGAKVNPDHTTVFIYYKVGNTIVNKEEIDLGNLTTQVDNLATNKANKDFNNVASNLDFVVESQVNEDGSWYRKYKSGWLEQGGNANDKHDLTINFIKPFINTNYMVEGERISGNIPLNIIKKTTTSFYPAGNRGFGCWFACGQGA